MVRYYHIYSNPFVVVQFQFINIVTRSSDNGETQRIIASMLYDRIRNDDDIILDHEDTIDYLTSEGYFDAMSQEVKRKEVDYNKLQPCLGYAPIDVIKRTIETTQFARNKNSIQISS